MVKPFGRPSSNSRLPMLKWVEGERDCFTFTGCLKSVSWSGLCHLYIFLKKRKQLSFISPNQTENQLKNKKSSIRPDKDFVASFNIRNILSILDEWIENKLNFSGNAVSQTKFLKDALSAVKMRLALCAQTYRKNVHFEPKQFFLHPVLHTLIFDKLHLCKRAHSVLARKLDQVENVEKTVPEAANHENSEDRSDRLNAIHQGYGDHMSMFKKSSDVSKRLKPHGAQKIGKMGKYYVKASDHKTNKRDHVHGLYKKWIGMDNGNEEALRRNELINAIMAASDEYNNAGSRFLRRNGFATGAGRLPGSDIGIY